MNKYHSGKIYKIISNETDKIYIGSTTEQTVAKRLAKHKSNFKDWLRDNTNTYTSSYELFKLGDVSIILLESYNCENKDELTSREQYYIDLNKDIVVNKILKPSKRTKQMIEEYQSQYYQDNKEKLDTYSKKRYQDNKETLDKKNKEYYEKNKEAIAEQRKQKIICICGAEINICSKGYHKKSKKHITFLLEQQTND